MGVGNAEVTEVSGRKTRREREEKGSTWMSLVATLSVKDGLLAGMDSWGGDVTPKGLGCRVRVVWEGIVEFRD
jgi:hypothetical protein